jgi:hypothetical protein
MRFKIRTKTENTIQAWMDADFDLIEVQHNGKLTWDELQYFKDIVWGKDAIAIEVYPPSGEVVNFGNFRHLWRWHKDPLLLPSIVDSGARGQ